MSWSIERQGRVALVTMNTNRVNAQGHAFFADFHEAFDALERDHPRAPVVLTGTGRSFSAGLDLEEHFRLFAGHRDAVTDWFAKYRAVMMRLFTYPRPTVAAINGHALAGGLIVAAVCDRNVCIEDGARLGLPELRIGVAMPAVYARLLEHAWGIAATRRLVLGAEVLTPVDLHRLGVVHEIRPGEEVAARAAQVADSVSDDAIDGYAFAKQGLQASALDDIARHADCIDETLADQLTSTAARRLHRDYWAEVQGAPATW